MRAIGGRAAAIVAAFVLASAAACTDEDPTPPSPTTSSATPTSPTPTSSSPAPQPESAEDFIRRWVEADIRMQNTGDSSDFLQLSMNCAPCTRFADLITGFYDAGGYVKTAGWRVVSIDDLQGSGRTRLLLVHVDGRSTTYKESSDGPTKHLPGERTQYQFTLRATGPSWVVRAFIEVAR